MPIDIETWDPDRVAAIFQPDEKNRSSPALPGTLLHSTGSFIPDPAPGGSTGIFFPVPPRHPGEPERIASVRIGLLRIPPAGVRLSGHAATYDNNPKGEGEGTGSRFEAVGSVCTKRFPMNDGGGFFPPPSLRYLRQRKKIGFDTLGESHLRYIKGLGGPWCVASMEADQKVQDTFPGEPLEEKEYHTFVEEFAGTCSCGGTYTFDAKPRCPRCHSSEYTQDPHGERVFYD